MQQTRSTPRPPKPPKPLYPTLGQQVEKIKILMPLFKAMSVKANLRKLITSQSLLEAHKHGDTVKVVTGTKVKHISEK